MLIQYRLNLSEFDAEAAQFDLVIFAPNIFKVAFA